MNSLLGKLLKSPAPPSSRAPDGVRIVAVGDIHGRLDLLDRLIAAIDAEPARDVAVRLVFLGDYIDRGPDSAGVVGRLAALKAARPDSVFLKGNHEAAMLDFLAHPEEGKAWLDWGGMETLESYGVPSPWAKPPAALASELLDRLPGVHGSFLAGLALSHSAGDYFFVHAGVRPGVALDAQAEDDLLWIRGAFHDAKPAERPDKVIVHGHHPVKTALDAGWRIAVDTGAVWTGVLTAVALEGETRRFISARSV